MFCLGSLNRVIVRHIKRHPLVVFIKVVEIRSVLIFPVGSSTAPRLPCVTAVVSPTVVFVIITVNPLVIFGKVLRHRWLRIARFVVPLGLRESVCIGATVA